MSLPQVMLVDHSAPLVAAWTEAFEGNEGVSVHQDDFFARDADALISPANSFGIMDGGLDHAIREALGYSVARAVKEVILERHHGELPIGCAEVVPTEHPRWPFLIVAPTMRIPESVASTVNAYTAFRAVLLAARRHAAAGGAPIRSLVCPGLGTGIGCLEPRRCAAQMRVAFLAIAGPARIPSFASIHEVHRAMRTA